MSYELKLYLDVFEAKSSCIQPEAVPARAIYVIEGALALRPSGGEATTIVLSSNSGAALSSEWSIAGASQPARVLRWDLVRAGAPQHLLVPAASESRLLLSAPLTLKPNEEYLLRCDRVDFPPSGEALTHTHQGGGIRCLLTGSIRVDTQGHSTIHAPMGAWFEAGPDPVYAAADATKPTAFARCMVLPRALLGGHSSIHYVNPADLNKPKSQRYQLFVDTPIET
ncbi:hypothetical protein [Paracandidimonas soli]|uniref:Uncharacterized protein n=1 Tax=Paracandidimonas soli TaxID=1917182 RepID=A0A4R3USF3_9BURK|nr:hypothetical protein [Paracandidimonas soli]TCU93690.1 hypothetical protein EV686_11142 [Paracandidimonas soli]